MIAPARLAAYRVLTAVSGQHADLPSALARAREDLHDERDRALTGEIATGTLRWRGSFDHLIRAYSSRPLERMDPEIVEILRLTLFQLLHLDRVPASAAVDDAVNMARKVGKGSAAPLVNAILRRASRERARLPLPPRVEDSREAALDYLSITLSHPRWLAVRWLDRYGFDAAESWCRFDNEPAPLTLRANRLRITRDDLAGRLLEAGVRTLPTRFAPDGLVVQSGNPLLTPLANTGLFSVQDEASQLVALAAAASPCERVLDACAAPGGKTTAMAADMENRGIVVAADVRPRRVRLLADTVRAAGASSVRVVQADAAQPLPFRDVFDCALVDVPCSGLGTLRRDPDIKWRRREPDFDALAALQMRILTAASAVIRAGGRLLYATCSSEPDENEHVIDRFLREAPAFLERPVSVPIAAEVVNERGHLRTDPFRHGLEAFFAASLVKAGTLR